MFNQQAHQRISQFGTLISALLLGKQADPEGIMAALAGLVRCQNFTEPALLKAEFLEVPLIAAISCNNIEPCQFPTLLFV